MDKRELYGVCRRSRHRETNKLYFDVSISSDYEREIFVRTSDKSHFGEE